MQKRRYIPAWRTPQAHKPTARHVLLRAAAFAWRAYRSSRDAQEWAAMLGLIGLLPLTTFACLYLFGSP